MKLYFGFLTCILGLLVIFITSKKSLAQLTPKIKTEQKKEQNAVRKSKMLLKQTNLLGKLPF
jgi:hypothetical protein